MMLAESMINAISYDQTALIQMWAHQIYGDSNTFSQWRVQVAYLNRSHFRYGAVEYIFKLAH